MTTTRKAWFALIAGAIIISTSPIVVKMAGVPGTSSAFYRVFIGFLSLLPIFFWRKPTSVPTGRTRWAIIAGGLFFAIDLVLWNEGLMHAPAASASLMANSAPLWVGLASMLLFKEKLTRNYWIGLTIAMVGMVVVASGALRLSPNDLFGLSLAAGASFCYAGYILSTRQARGGTDTITFMVWSLAIASIVIYPIALWLGTPLWGFDMRSWMFILFLGIFTQTIGWIAINYALGHLPAPITSVMLLGQVVLAAVLAVPLLGEPIRASQLIGGAFILGGIVLVNRK